VPRHKRRLSLGWRIFRAASVLCICAGLGVGGWLGWFFWHSSAGGKQLLNEARERIAQSLQRPTSNANCIDATGAVGELVIPDLSLMAPVVQGDGQAQLADAVGHVPTSAWPGRHGAAVLVGHDVTWFHELGQLQAGATIEYVDGCQSFDYEVTSTKVVTRGAAVADAPGTLALVTCWPLDALWFTGKRLLVEAHEVGGTSGVPPVQVADATRPPPVSVPKDLQGVDSRATNPTPLGALSVSGSPRPTFTESPAPLTDASAAESLYFAAVRAAMAGDGADWATIAPGVPFSKAAPLKGATITYYDHGLSTALEVSGSQLVGAQLSCSFVLTGGESGRWTISVGEALSKGKLVVTTVTLNQT
jgi:sortase A